MAPPRRRRMPSCGRRASSSSPTFSPTRAGWSSPTSSGCKTATAISGRKRSCASVWRRRCGRPSTTSWGWRSGTGWTCALPPTPWAWNGLWRRAACAGCMDEPARRIREMSARKARPAPAPTPAGGGSRGDGERHPAVVAYLDKANEYTGGHGYTENGTRPANLTASIAYNILKRLGTEERQAQLAAIAGYLHDIGNLVGRINHEYAGALLADRLLEKLGMDSPPPAP